MCSDAVVGKSAARRKTGLPRIDRQRARVRGHRTKKRSAALLKSEVRILVILIIAEIWRRDAPNFYVKGQVFFMV